MVLISLFAQKALCDAEIYSDILNEKGLDIAGLIGIEGYPQIKDLVVKDIVGTYPVRQLVIDAINFGLAGEDKMTNDGLEYEYKSIISQYTDNNTEIKDALPGETWDGKDLKLLSKTFPHFAPFLKEKGYNISEIQKCIDNVLNKNGSCTYKDVARILKLSTEFYFNVTDKVREVMTADTYKIQDIGTTLYLNASIITNFIKDIPAIFKKGRANVAEMSGIAYNVFKFLQGLYGSSKIFLGKTIHTLLEPYVYLFPHSVDEMKKDIEMLVKAYEDLINDKNFTKKELESVTKRIVDIYNDFKRQLNDKTILVPPKVKNFLKEFLYMFNPNRQIVELITGLNLSIIDNFLDGNKDIILPILDLFPEPIPIKEFSSYAKKYYDENTPIDGFELEWLDDIAFLSNQVKEYPSSMKINNILTLNGMNMMNASVVKTALLNISKIFNEITLEDHITRTIATIFMNMAKATNDDVKIIDYVKCLPFGESLAMYYQGLDNYNNGKSLKDAFWDWQFEGMYVMRTFEAWKGVKVPSFKNLAKAVVTVNATGDKFVKGLLDLYALVIKNDMKITRNQICKTAGGVIERIIDYTVPIVASNNLNASSLIHKYFDVNVTKFAYTVEKIAKEASSGAISWESFVEFNKKVDEELLQPFNQKYDDATKAKMAAAARKKKLTIIICSIIGAALVIGAAVFAIVLYRKKNGKYQDVSTGATGVSLV